MPTNEWTWSVRDGWRELDTEPLAWPSGSDMDDILRQAGYRRSIETDLEDALEFLPGAPTVYTWQGDEAPPTGYHYHCWVSLPDSAFLCVWLPDGPTLLDFLRTYSPMAWTLETATRLKDLHTTIAKLFQAWHGHSPDGVCLDCDPDTYRQLQQERQRYAAQRAAHEAARAQEAG